MLKVADSRCTLRHDSCLCTTNMFRAAIEADSEGSVIRVAGRLTVEEVSDLERMFLSAKPPVVIDASELRSCDDEGVAFLARVRDGTASVEGLSEYLLMRVRIEVSHGSREPTK